MRGRAPRYWRTPWSDEVQLVRTIVRIQHSSREARSEISFETAVWTATRHWRRRVRGAARSVIEDASAPLLKARRGRSGRDAPFLLSLTRKAVE